MLLLSFLALLPRTLLGFLIVHSLWRSTDPKDLAIKAALAGPIGIGVSSLAAFFWIWAGLDLRLYASLETAGTALWMGIVVWQERALLLQAIRSARPRLSGKAVFWLALLALGLLLFAGEFWTQVLPVPHGRWDAWWNWNVVSRFIYRGGVHWTGTFLRTDDHPDYPLLLPISNALTWSLLPRETTRGPIALAFFYGVSLALLLFSLIAKLRGGVQASLGAFVMIAQPFVAYYGMMLFADLPLSVYLLGSIGLMLVFLSGHDQSLPVLAGIMAGLAGWTKNEGLPFLISCTLTWIYIAFVLEKQRSVLGRFLAGLSLPLIAIVCFKLFLAPANDLLSGGQDIAALMVQPGRYWFILSKSFQVLWSMKDGSLSVILILLIYAILVGATRTSVRGLAPLLFIIMVQAATYFVIFLTSPHDLDWHIRSSIGRLYLHVFPALILGLFLWLKSPAELTSRTVREEYAAHS